MAVVLGLLLAIVPPLSSIQQVLSQEKTDQYIKEWLSSPIKYIITKEESNTYKKLKIREDKLRFINYFWLRRDPNPQTLVNEFRDEFLRRVAYSNKYFKIGKKEGWKSQRGQIFIVFGPYSEVHKGVTSSLKSYEVWLFYRLPSKNLPSNYALIFIDWYGNRDFRVAYGDYFGKSYFERLRDRSYFMPGSGFMPAEIVSAIEDMKKLSIVNSNLALKDVSVPLMTQPQVPFKFYSLYFQSDETVSQLLLGLNFRYKDIFYQNKGGSKVGPSLAISASLLDEEKDEVDSFSKKVIFSIDSKELEEKKDEKFFLWRSLEAQPGKYLLSIKAEDELAGAKSIWEKEINIPAIRNKELFISKIIPASKIVYSPEIQPEEEILNTIRLMGYQITPNLDTVYDADSELCFFFQLINLQLDPQSAEAEAEIKCHIFKDDKIFQSLKLPNSAFKSRKSDEILASYCISLTDFPAGEYFLIIQAIDKITNKDISSRLNFKVLEKSS